MQTIALASPLSMVGSMLFRELQHECKFVLILSNPQQEQLLQTACGTLEGHQTVLFNLGDIAEDFVTSHTGTIGPKARLLTELIGDVDAVINCASIVKQPAQQQPLLAWHINTVLPHVLSRCYGEKLIHISTDCVFNGQRGVPYTENDAPSATDLYGLTRMLGEPKQHSLVLRTSTIGPEIQDFTQLFEWVKQQEGKTISGYTEHLWNGLTTRQLAKAIRKILFDRPAYPQSGVFHIFGEDMTKFDLLTAITRRCNVQVDIQPKGGERLDRRLRTIRDMQVKLNIPSFPEMLSQL